MFYFYYYHYTEKYITRHALKILFICANVFKDYQKSTINKGDSLHLKWRNTLMLSLETYIMTDKISRAIFASFCVKFQLMCLAMHVVYLVTVFHWLCTFISNEKKKKKTCLTVVSCIYITAWFIILIFTQAIQVSFIHTIHVNRNAFREYYFIKSCWQIIFLRYSQQSSFFCHPNNSESIFQWHSIKLEKQIYCSI